MIRKAMMDGIVEAAHPVPVEFVPQRGRLARFALVRATTPVEVRRVDADVPRLVHTFLPHERHPGSEAWEIGGRAWLRIPGAAADGTLRAFLAGGTAGTKRTSILQEVFAGTPLSWHAGTSMEQGGVDPDHDVDVRGGPLQAGARLTSDHGEACRHALDRILADGLRVAGDDAFVSPRGPLAVRLPSGTVCMDAGANGGALACLPLDHPRYRAHCGPLVRRHGPARAERDGRCELHPLAPFGVPGEDLRHFANVAPRETLRLLRPGPHRGNATPEAVALVGRLVAWRRLGGVGLVAPEDVAEVAADVIAAGSHPELRRSAGHIGSAFLNEIVIHAREHVLARRDPEPDPGDEDAMSGLAP